MIKIKDYIFNEKEIVSIEPISGGLRVDLKSKSDYIDIYASFEDIEWNYEQSNIKDDEYIELSNEYQRLSNRNEELEEKYDKALTELAHESHKRIELEEENENLQQRIDKVIEYITKNIELNNGSLSNREELIVSKHDLIKNEINVLNCLIDILKGEE